MAVGTATAIALTAALASGAVGAYGAHEQGKAASRAASAEADMKRRKGQQEFALSQQRAADERSDADSLASDLIARASMFGGGSTDKNVVDMLGDIESKGESNALSQLYEGKMRKQDLDYAAELTSQRGRSARRAGNIQSFSTVLDTVGSMASIYAADTTKKPQAEAPTVKKPQAKAPTVKKS